MIFPLDLFNTVVTIRSYLNSNELKLNDNKIKFHSLPSHITNVSSHICLVATILNSTDVDQFHHGRKFYWATLDIFHWGNCLMDTITVFVCLITALQTYQTFLLTAAACNYNNNCKLGTHSSLVGICTLIALCFGWVNKVLFCSPKLEFGNHPLLGHARTFQIKRIPCLKISSSTARIKVYKNCILLSVNSI